MLEIYTTTLIENNVTLLNIIISIHKGPWHDFACYICINRLNVCNLSKAREHDWLTGVWLLSILTHAGKIISLVDDCVHLTY